MSTGEDMLSWGYLHTILSEGMVRMVAKTNSLTPLTYSSSKIPLVLNRMRQKRGRADTEQSADAESSRYEVGDQVVMLLLVLPMCPTFNSKNIFPFQLFTVAPTSMPHFFFQTINGEHELSTQSLYTYLLSIFLDLKI